MWFSAGVQTYPVWSRSMSMVAGSPSKENLASVCGVNGGHCGECTGLFTLPDFSDSRESESLWIEPRILQTYFTGLKIEAGSVRIGPGAWRSQDNF